mmetsp:Transcript_1722/g.3677  ORF Transcript_1722/g.3677 Transcript_1722/m.3677 type:complete len:300 (+) Transcript_1722:384-1283(+)|eukprot:CAMPEP_0172321904 /NCGR_PEP_ID=MMETSP1058-20130122/44593_1 /TAXON_ID=83371 /ORGANISM="Detonula confervacea, Strain CCMP 353" /LENGTH=299 /DNA_ID=CAMNT_0013037517 /DNA_START=334 /DNA_END=1236 /DNA_ORIENTATION=-
MKDSHFGMKHHQANATAQITTKPSHPHRRLCIILAIFLFNSHSAKCLSATPNKPSNWSAINEVLPPDYYRQVYNNNNDNDTTSEAQQSIIPWDVGGPQPCIKKEAKTGIFANKSILDCGCGLGENAQFLAGNVGRARSVTGFDISSDAIRRASERMEMMGNDGEGSLSLSQSSNNVSYRVASCTELNESFTTRETFDVAVDSACLHCLSDEDAIAYANSLKDLVTERLFVGCFSTANDGAGWSNPRRLSRKDLERYFVSEYWEILRIEDVWWARPSARGSNQGGFCHGLWMEAVRKKSN